MEGVIGKGAFQKKKCVMGLREALGSHPASVHFTTPILT